MKEKAKKDCLTKHSFIVANTIKYNIFKIK